MAYGFRAKECAVPMKATLFYIFGILLLVGVAGYLMIENKSSAQLTPNTIDNGEFQKVVIGVKDFNYYPNTINVRVNEPVRIYLDKSVGGCLRTFTITEFGIAKYLRTPNDYIEFTPTKKGTFRFACSMGMGTGTLIVE